MGRMFSQLGWLIFVFIAVGVLLKLFLVSLSIVL